MWTRKDYINEKCSHQEYYGQFYTHQLVDYIRRTVGEKRIKKSKDKYFNDISLSVWDAQAVTVRRMVGDISKYGESWTLSTAVCIAKEAARRIRDGR